MQDPIRPPKLEYSKRFHRRGEHTGLESVYWPPGLCWITSHSEAFTFTVECFKHSLSEVTSALFAVLKCRDSLWGTLLLFLRAVSSFQGMYQVSRLPGHHQHRDINSLSCHKFRPKNFRVDSTGWHCQRDVPNQESTGFKCSESEENAFVCLVSFYFLKK